MKKGALIIASGDYGEEYRDNEGIPLFLPMYPLDGTTVIKGEIAKLRKAGVSPIVVLAGCHSETLKLHLSHNNVIFLEDENYRAHSFEETLAIGLTGCASLMERVLVLPVEYPACADSTITALLFAEKSAVPTYDGQEGWPRSIVLSEMNEESGTETVVSGSGMKDERIFDSNVRTGSRFLPTEDPGVTYSLQEEGGVERITRYLKAQWDATTLHFKTKLVISREEDFFGPGVYHLLRCIDETGSIQAAAAKMNMSYSKGWKMINKVEKELGFRLLNRCNGGKNGGSSSITPEGRLFMERYHAMLEDMKRITRGFFEVYFGEFQ